MRLARVYFESYGCQMNAFDTEVMESILLSEGCETAGSPEDADVIVVNTCSVRENAERRAIGRLNDLSRHGDAVLVVTGCMAQRLGGKLFEEVPGLSVVAGPDTYGDLASTIREALAEGGKKVMTGTRDDITYSLMPGAESTRISRFLSITRGCENYCSYCIVPYLRGPVRSKPLAGIIGEVEILIESGAREVTLLGQNVMAYRSDDADFIELVRAILDRTDLERLRFLTTHPRDADERVFEIMDSDPRLCPHMHLPFQSGSDRILSVMNRGYTRDQYVAILDRARAIKPDIAFTTDIIVGFPTETEEDFEYTVDLAERGGFDSAFTFKYSARTGTAAAGMDDDVPAETKKSRLERLNSVIQRVRKEILRNGIGKVEEILLDGTVKKGEYQFWKGRTPHFRNVLIRGKGLKKGDIVPVRMTELRNFTYIGEEV